MGGLTLNSLVEALEQGLMVDASRVNAPQEVFTVIDHLLGVSREEVCGAREGLKFVVARQLAIEGLSVYAGLNYEAIANVLQRPYETVARLHAELKDFRTLEDQVFTPEESFDASEKGSVQQLVNVCKGLQTQQIIALIADAYGRPLAEVLSIESRKRDIVKVRDVAMYVLRQCTAYSLEGIGELFGDNTRNFSGTKVRLAVAKIGRLLELPTRASSDPPDMREYVDPPGARVGDSSVIAPAQPSIPLNELSGVAKTYYAMGLVKYVRVLLSDPSPIQVDDIVKKFSVMTGLDEHTLRNNSTGSRRAPYSATRAAMALVLRERYSMSLEGIGEVLKRDHSSITNLLSVLKNAGLYCPTVKKNDLED